jgi:hypothetical protein
MVTVSGADALTKPDPDGVVPLPLIVTVEVPGATVVPRPFDPPQDANELIPSPRMMKKQRLEMALPLEIRRRAKTRSKAAIAPGRKKPAVRRDDPPAGRAPTTVPDDATMVIVPCAGFSLPSAFWLPGNV